MTKSKTTKKALFASALSLILCFAMLLGTTYAWFTDSVTSANNIIKSGTLDISLEYQSLDNGTWGTKTEITNEAQSTAIFNYDKWEPGYSEVKLVTISNKGTLALKYKLNVVAHLRDGETAVSKLADVIDVYYLELPAGTTSVTAPTSFADAKAAGLVKVGTLADVINNNITTANGALLPAGSTATPTEKEAVGSVSFVMMLHMQEEAGNEYQGLSIGNGFDLQLLATQYTEETDSFDDQYDKDALFPVATASEMKTALSEGKSVTLANDIVYDELPVQFTKDAKIDLAGNTLTFAENDLTVSAFYVNGATLDIINSTDEEVTIDFERSDMNASAGYADSYITAQNGATINFENVNVNVSDNEVNAIYVVQGSTVNWNEGKIVIDIENQSEMGSGPIYIDKGTFNMNGGEIEVKRGNGAIVVEQIQKKNGFVNINLNGGKITVADVSTPAVYVVRYDVNINYSDSFVFNGNNIYTAMGGYTHNITVNGVAQ